MKSCNYCGTENEDVLEFCAGCGTKLPPLAPPVIEPPVVSEEPPIIAPPLLPLAPLESSPPTDGIRVLEGGLATAMLGIFIGAQLIAGMLVGLFGAVLASIHGEYQYGDAIRQVMPLAILLSMVFSAIALVWAAIGFRFQLNDGAPTGAAWIRGSWWNIVKGLVTGLLVALFWILVLSHVGPNYLHEEPPDALSRMIVGSRFSQIAWLISVVFLAPPFEELLFRGILYGGYRKSLGATAAATLTTFIFVSLHFQEFIYQPMAVFAITGLALAALWQRLRSNAIGPAIATHFAYNTAIAIGVLFSS